MTNKPALTLYSRQWCHLCHDMEAALRQLQREFSFDLEVWDVDADPALEARFDELVPVLMAGEQELARYRLDEAAFRQWCSPPNLGDTSPTRC